MKQIGIKESTVQDALKQIDQLEDLGVRNRNCLRLLTEEMFSMLNELLKADTPDFEVGWEDQKYTLKLSARTRVSEEARKQFLSMSSDGKNAANKGIKGMLGAVVESFLYDSDGDTTETPWAYGLCSYEQGFSHMWMLSQYIDAAPKEAVKSDWDGMEKSIIANFADDVIIAVRSGRLEMTVTKAF